MDVVSSVKAYFLASPFLRRLASVLLVTLIVILCFHVILGISVLIYSVFYYFYVPVAYHSFPIYFDFLAERPFSYFPVSSGTKPLFHANQGYNIFVVLKLPESPDNIHSGMFMVDLALTSTKDKALSLVKSPPSIECNQV
jgi:hypothetical protein